MAHANLSQSDNQYNVPVAFARYRKGVDSGSYELPYEFRFTATLYRMSYAVQCTCTLWATLYSVHVPYELRCTVWATLYRMNKVVCATLYRRGFFVPHELRAAVLITWCRLSYSTYELRAARIRATSYGISCELLIKQRASLWTTGYNTIWATCYNASNKLLSYELQYEL